MLEEYNTILERVSNLIREGFDREPVYRKEYLKTEIKSYDSKVKINFYLNKTPKEGAHCVCSSIILVDSAFKIHEHYYPQKLLEECEYVEKKIK